MGQLTNYYYDKPYMYATTAMNHGMATTVVAVVGTSKLIAACMERLKFFM